MSVLFAAGVGCLAGGLAVLLLGWRNNAVYLIGRGAGLFTASILIGMLTRSGHALFRVLRRAAVRRRRGIGDRGFDAVHQPRGRSRSLPRLGEWICRGRDRI